MKQVAEGRITMAHRRRRKLLQEHREAIDEFEQKRRLGCARWELEKVREKIARLEDEIFGNDLDVSNREDQKGKNMG